MHIVEIASEFAPIAKIGGLGDVLLGLSRELTLQGHQVDIIIPKYDCIDSRPIRDLRVVYHNLMSPYEGEWHRNTVWVGWVDNLKIYMIESHHQRLFFNRGCIYGCEDDIERFLYFSRCALEFLYKSDMQPDIIHLHDWQTAPIAPLYRLIYNEIGYDPAKLVFTIHNIEYQGKCSPIDLNKVGLDSEALHHPDLLQDEQNPALVNHLKGAIVFSDAVTTVSPSYAVEILTHEGGKGLEHVLKKHDDKLVGILNGLDYTYWNPETDPYISVHYSVREKPGDECSQHTIDKKAFIKKQLRERLMLDEVHRPILGVVARLVPQKGLDLIRHALYHTLDHEGQFVLLGSSPIPSIDAEFHALKRQFADHPHVSLILKHDESLAHQIFAGSDMFIVPSLFEPCGLVQMIALRYGSVPIVRRTGGLADTIFDVDGPDKNVPYSNGYTFDAPNEEAVKSVLNRAFTCWYHDPKRWRELMLRCMRMDYSWKEPAREYFHLFEDLIG